MGRADAAPAVHGHPGRRRRDPAAVQLVRPEPDRHLPDHPLHPARIPGLGGGHPGPRPPAAGPGRDGRLLGFACAHRYHPREAFDWDVESTIYCAPDACSAGVGKALYGALLELLRMQGYWNVYALLADPNPASERFHAKFGFVCVGRQPHTGYKFGRWGGMSIWWLPLRRGRAAPAPVRLRLEDAEVAAVLKKYTAT